MRYLRWIAPSLLGALLVVSSAVHAQELMSRDPSASETQEAALAAEVRTPGMCIPPDAPEHVNACPSALPVAVRGRSGERPTSRLRESKRVDSGTTAQLKRGPSIQLDVATLRNKEQIQVRANQLLTREIQVTQRLLKNMRTSDQRRADVLLRLAENYFELTQATNAELRELDDPLHEACTVNQDQRRCAAVRQEQRSIRERLAKVREANNKTLATLVTDHPDYPKMDEVLFSLGFSLEEMKQFDKARRVYRQLIQHWPQSRFIPNAYLSFAEYYFQQGDMGAAQQFYAKVTETPPEQNKVYGYAVYKQAWCHYNLEDYRASLQSFVQTITFGQQHPQAPGVTNLVRQARRELVMPYAQSRSPERALEFFRRYAKDEANALELLESLGELYFDTGKWPETITVYKQLMVEQPHSEQICKWQGKITNAVVASQPKGRQVEELKRMIGYVERFGKANHSAEAVQVCQETTAAVLVDLATAWHREAIGSDEQPGTNDLRTMEEAATLYKLLLTHFPNMEELEFPTIDRRDWPTLYRIAYYYAELLWRMESWSECGPAFDRVLELDPQGEFTEDAAYASVLCYNKQYMASYAKRETLVREDSDSAGARRQRRQKGETPDRQTMVARFAPKELSPLEDGMLKAYQRYICYVQDGDDLAQIKYRRGRIFYESNRFEEAAVLFKDIAFNHQDSDLAVFAANLYLDSLNVLGSYREPSRPACYDEMNDAIEPMHNMYCSSDEDRADNDSLCQVLEQLRCDLLRKKAESLQASREYKSAAQLYVRIFRQYGECGDLDEVLYNAAINFEASRLLGRAIKVRQVLIDRYPDSELSKRALYLIGANYHALAFYEVAADYYERFAQRYPGELGNNCSERQVQAGTCVVANEALQNAVFFRLGLGDEDKAVEDASLFEENYRRRFPRQTSQVIYSLGSIYEREENWQGLIKHYSDYLRRYRRTALPHELIEANVAIGKAILDQSRAESGAAKRKPAEAYFRTALKIWRAAKDRFGQLEGTEAERKRYLAKAKIGVAEALFHLADQEFEAYQRIEFPVFKARTSRRGRARQEDLQRKFQRWMQVDFVKWLGRKSGALTEAQRAYERISQLQVPQWDIAAASRIGDMYLDLVNEFRDAPVPPVLERDEELVDIYYQGLDEASKPWVQKAKDAYEFCLITATKVRWFNKFMTSCEEELFKLDPRKYPRAMELRGSNTYSYSIEAMPGVPDLGAEKGGVE